MYVHIGKDIVINSENIVAILDIESLQKNKNLQEVLQKLKISGKIIEITDKSRKSLIIINKDKENKVYLSNISSTTIGKRASNKK